MLEDLLETWNTHHAIHQRMLRDLPEGGLEAVGASGGMSVGRQFGHTHAVRVRWVEGTAEELVAGGVRFGRDDSPSREQLLEALEQSGRAVAGLIRSRGADGRGVSGFPGSLTAWVGYLISHESHHRGQMLLALKDGGRALERGAATALWKGWWGEE